MKFYIAPGRENTKTNTFPVVSGPGELFRYPAETL